MITGEVAAHSRIYAHTQKLDLLLEFCQLVLDNSGSAGLVWLRAVVARSQRARQMASHGGAGRAPAPAWHRPLWQRYGNYSFFGTPFVW